MNLRRTTSSIVSVVIILGCAAICTSAQTEATQKKKHAPAPNAVIAAAPLESGFSTSSHDAKVTHLLQGRSFTINTKSRLTRVYVSNPAALDAYTVNPNELLVTAKQPGTASLVLWDETGSSQPYLISSDVDVEPLKASLKQAMASEKIGVEGDGSHIVLTGYVSRAENADAAVKLASLYSKDVSNALTVNSASIKQVKLQVRIVEVDRSKLEQFGFNFFSAGGSILAQTTTAQFPSTLSATTNGAGGTAGGVSSTVGDKTVAITNPLNFLLYSSRLNVGAMIRDLESKQVLQILAEPNITTISGQKANFLAGGEFPFPVVQGTTGGLTSITVQFRPYGVRLDFLPVVNPDDTIQLNVAPEVSALDYTNAVNISGYTIPALSTRRAETGMVLRSGQSFAISGLLDKRTTDAYSKTPGIASVPVLGQLFKSKQLNRSTTELLVIVTPVLVDPLSNPDQFHEPEPVVPMLDTDKFDSTLPVKAQK